MALPTALSPFMRLPLRTRIGLAFGLWLLAEALTFLLVVRLVGGGGALVLGIATSVFGAVMLKRLGTSALASLRRGDGFALRDVSLEGPLAGIGALCLLLPGFLTDAIGLILAIAPVRSRLAQWVDRPAPRNGRAPSRPTTIDLGPSDWRSVDEGGPPSAPRV